MAFDLHLWPDIADYANTVNEEGRSYNSHEFSPHEFFFLPHTVCLAECAILIRYQLKIELEFIGKIKMRVFSLKFNWLYCLFWITVFASHAGYYLNSFHTSSKQAFLLLYMYINEH